MVVSIGAMCMVDGGEQTYGGHVHGGEHRGHVDGGWW